MPAFLRPMLARVTLAAITTAFLIPTTGVAAEHATLHVYGPGGPAPVFKELARAYAASHQISIEVVAGPTQTWVESAKGNADIVFSGAENMMSDFARSLPGMFDLNHAEPLYLRPTAILVRRGNPKNIRGFEDLLKPGIKVLTVAGAGQTGLWEDVAGRTGNIEKLKAFRRNLMFPEAANSADARDQWTKNTDIDAWLIWNIWHTANPDLAELVQVEEPYRIYRSASIVLTSAGMKSADAQAFYDYVKSEEGRKVFSKWGWKTN